MAAAVGAQPTQDGPAPPPEWDVELTIEQAIVRVANDPMTLVDLPTRFKADPGVVFSALCQDVYILEVAHESLLDDPEFMLRALAKDVSALDYASDRLVSDIDFMTRAIRVNWQSIRFASHQLASETSLVWEAVEQCWKALAYVSTTMQSDRKLLELGLSQSGLALEYAAGPLRRDRELAITAVRQTWTALEHVAPYMRVDPDILLAATQQCWQAIKFVPRWTKVGLPVMREAVRQNWKAIKLFLGDVHSEAELLALAKENPRIIQHQVLGAFRMVVLAAVKKNGLVLQYASANLQGDREIVVTAVTQNPAALGHACQSLRQDPRLIALAAPPPDPSRTSVPIRPVPPSWKVAQGPDDDSDCSSPSPRSSSSGSSRSSSFRFFDRVHDLKGEHAVALERASLLLERYLSEERIIKAQRPSSRHQKPCDLAKLLQRLWAHPYSRTFTPEPGEYGKRGGWTYYKPRGWNRLSVRRERKAIEDWAVAYHGTTVEKAVWIVAEGLQKPTMWKDVAHGQANSTSKQTIYVSPSLEYAGHPVYATLAKVGRSEWIQAVLQLRVRPGSFDVRPGTLGNKYWDADLRVDPYFPCMEGLEWLLEDAKDVAVTGIMLRELGRGADPDIFGDAASRVTEGERGPEYEWTRLQCEQLREEGWMVRPVVCL